jgi:hypothetical protein
VGTVNREAEFVYVQFFMFIRGYGCNLYSALNAVNTSRGPNRGVGGGQCGCVYVIFSITANFGYLKNLNQRTGWFQVFGGNQNQRTISSRYFKTLKERSGFMKEPANYCQVCNLNLKHFAG